MPTYTALTTVTGKAPAEAMGAALERLEPTPYGVGVFEVEDGSGLWEVGAYFTDVPNEAALALVAAAFSANDFVVSELPDTDWVAHVRRELAPVEAGQFFVYGAHDADKLPKDKIGLLIEAAMAFGTGHHGTTLGCLKAFDALVQDGHRFQKVADIGCGTGVLGMAAAKLWSNPVWVSDIDPVAVDVARANAAANDVDATLVCLEAAGFDHTELQAAAPFDLVFANILKGPLIDLSPTIYEHLDEKGFAILSGILNEQADEVIDVYCQNGFNLVDRQEIVEWTSLTLQKVI